MVGLLSLEQHQYDHVARNQQMKRKLTWREIYEMYSPSDSLEFGSIVKRPLTIAPGKYAFLESRTVTDIQLSFITEGFSKSQIRIVFVWRIKTCLMILLWQFLMMEKYIKWIDMIIV